MMQEVTKYITLQLITFIYFSWKVSKY